MKEAVKHKVQPIRQICWLRRAILILADWRLKLVDKEFGSWIFWFAQLTFLANNTGLQLDERDAVKQSGFGISNIEYPDFLSVAKDIQDFLTNYPNDGDYWEIVNKKLTQMVLEKYPVLSSITSEMQVSPSRLNSYIRSSIATRYQSKKVKIVNRTN